MCGTQTGTETVLNYVLELEPHVLHKSKELQNTGWYVVNHCGFRCGTGINEKKIPANAPS